MPHSSKKYRKSETQANSSNRITYIVVALIVVIVASAGGWYAYSSFNTTSTPYCTTTQQIACAKIYTTDGVIDVQLFQSQTPKTVANFEHLAQSGFYDNLVWHRIVQGFVIQTGDPLTRNGSGNRSLWGTGGSNTSVPLEAASSLHNSAGTLAMAHTSASTNATSQFYINLVDNTNLDGSYTVFGKVVNGMDVVNKIGGVAVYTNQSSPLFDQPITLVYMTNVTIVNSIQR